MTALIIAAGTVSQPIFAPPGSLVTVTPSQGASAKVEYTKGSGADVINGVATWATWSRGASVSSATSDVLNEPAYLRVTATSGSVTLTTDETPAAALLDAYRVDWASAQTQSSATSGVTVLAQSGVTSSVTGTTSETVLATVTIPGGTLGAGSILRVYSYWDCTSNTNVKTPKVKLGSSAYTALSSTTSNFIPIATVVWCLSSTSQVGGSANSTTGLIATATGVTGNLDLTQDQVLSFTGQLATGTDTLTLRMYKVEVL